MQRDMKIVIDIMKAIAEYPGNGRDVGSCFVVSEELDSVIRKRPEAVIISAETCSDETMFYHLGIMEEAKLVGSVSGRLTGLEGSSVNPASPLDLLIDAGHLSRFHIIVVE